MINTSFVNFSINNFFKVSPMSGVKSFYCFVLFLNANERKKLLRKLAPILISACKRVVKQ